MQWFHSELVMRHVGQLAVEWRPLLDRCRRPLATLPREGVAGVQRYLHALQQGRAPLTYVGVHVRRTDYLQWVEKRYRGRPVDQGFFLHCMEEYRKTFGPAVVFLVTSDDPAWCRWSPTS